MFKNYLTIAIRNLLRHKGYSLINIVGLAMGMACCILLLLYIQHELSYDRFHQKADQIYRLVHEEFATTPAPWAPFLVSDFPEVLQAVRIKTPYSGWYIKSGKRSFWEKGLFFADAAFFDLFDGFSLVRGNPKTALVAPNAVVITESAARKYFGDDDPLGQSLIAGNDLHLMVTGIMPDMPGNAHFRCDLLVSFSTLEIDHRWYGNITDFSTQGFNLQVYTYLLMQKDYPAAEFADKIPAFREKYLGDQANKGLIGGRFELQPLTDIYLFSNKKGEIGVTSDIKYVYIFATLAFFLILLACINFMNLATARTAYRAKEVAMRKVVGAHRGQVILQFVGESTGLAFVALLLALVLVNQTLPLFNELAGRQIVVNYTEVWLWLTFLGITIFVGILAGSYPALFLSAFQPVTVLKGTLPSGLAKTLVRKVLVVLQFVISIVMIIGTGIAFRQLNYLQNKTLGFDKEHLVVVPLSNASMRQRYPILKQALLQHADIVQVTGSSSVPGEQTFGRYLMRPAGAEKEKAGVVALYATDYEYVPTLGIELVAGRSFSHDVVTDAHQAALINESAVQALGLESPIGTQLELSVPLTRTVIGVVRDFHTQSLHHPIEPIMLIVSPLDFAYTIIRFRGEHLSQTLKVIQKTWEEIYPDYPFEYSFLDQDLDKLYHTEQRMQKIFGVAALVSIVIACLGVFGLSSFVVERRTKEIGIRKVIGASKLDILQLLSREYVTLVLLANLIAWPIAYFVMRDWLQNFAYRIDMGVGTFVLSGVLILVIVLFTISYQSIKATLANPVDALRYE